MWSLGIILYELCTFNKPFMAGSLDELKQKVTKQRATPLPPGSVNKELADLIGKLLRKQPSKRPSIVEILGLPIVKKKA